jgi:hypothetical protein
LIQSDLNRKTIAEEEKLYIKIKGAQTTSRFDRNDQRSAEDIKKQQDEKDLDHFFTKYPGLEEEKLKDLHQFDKNQKGRLLFKNPDLSFCNFVISLSMFVISIIMFYSHRDFSNEFFNRELIKNTLEESQYQNLHDISNLEDFYYFLNSTIAQQLFESEKSIKQRSLHFGETGYDETYVSQYMFQHGVIPLGKLRIRQQRRAIIDCPEINVPIINERKAAN